jgi:hypothetical protein
MYVVVFQTRPDYSFAESYKLQNYTQDTVWSYDFNTTVPSSNPPPVPVSGPLIPGDPRGLTFSVNSLDDAQTFQNHVISSGLVNTSWIFNEDL